MKNRYADYSENELIAEALLVQDACNLSGVVHSFSAALTRLWQLRDADNRIDVNTHRVSKLFADKIKSLAGETTLQDWEPVG